MRAIALALQRGEGALSVGSGVGVGGSEICGSRAILPNSYGLTTAEMAAPRTAILKQPPTLLSQSFLTRNALRHAYL